MIHRINLGSRFQTAKVFVLGLMIGAVATALTLDNRFGAMLKAFNSPQVINGITISAEVIKK